MTLIKDKPDDKLTTTVVQKWGSSPKVSAKQLIAFVTEWCNSIDNNGEDEPVVDESNGGDESSGDDELENNGDDESETGDDENHFEIGQRVSVFWTGEKQWFEGDVIDVDNGGNLIQIHYLSDSTELWHDVDEESIRLV